MRRSVLGALPILLFALFVWLVNPVNARAASGKIIYTFQGGADGAYPYSDLAIDAAGNLYGTTSDGGVGCGGYGCGTVYELLRTNNGWKHRVLYSFAGSSARSFDGLDPEAGVVFDNSGNLYGTTVGGGRSGCGTLFRLAPNSHGAWSERVLYNFGCNSDGHNPKADLVFDNQGNLYGTTPAGGTGTGFCGGEWSGCGIVFKLSPNPDGSWTETTIYNFQGAPDAAIPIGALVPDGKGGFYGESQYGGSGTCNPGQGPLDPPNGCGAVFELDPSAGGWTENVIFSFFLGRGFARAPAGGLIVARPNLLFGTSSVGGNGLGTLLQLNDMGKGWNQSILHRFYEAEGRTPVGRLAEAPKDTWFGVTQGGGMNGSGTVFESTQAGLKERILFNFDRTAGSPAAGPTVDSRGHVYGTTPGSSNGNNGTVYEVIP